MSFAQSNTESAISTTLAPAVAYAPAADGSANDRPSHSTLILRQFAGGSVGGMMLILSGHP